MILLWDSSPYRSRDNPLRVNRDQAVRSPFPLERLIHHDNRKGLSRRGWDYMKWIGLGREEHGGRVIPGD